MPLVVVLGWCRAGPGAVPDPLPAAQQRAGCTDGERSAENIPSIDVGELVELRLVFVGFLSGSA